MSKFVFGPVNSRRLKVSLGINLTPPKTCSMDCIYCECGKTTNLSSSRQTFYDPEDINKELAIFLEDHPYLDFITFSGTGEPTLYKGLGKITKFIKKNYDYKIALITNSSLLHLDEIYSELEDIDLIIPTLNAIDESIFQKINRSKISCTKIQEGLLKLSKNFTGSIWLEIFVLDQNYEHIPHLAEFVKNITVSKIQLNSLDRPGTIKDLKPVAFERLLKLLPLFNPIPTEIITRHDLNIDYPNLDNVINLLLNRFVNITEIIKLTGDYDFVRKLSNFEVITKKIDCQTFIKIK